MVASLREAMIENAESGLIFGNADHFAETGSYTPSGGTAVTVDATAVLRELPDSEDGVVDRDQEELIVCVCKNPDAARGGIATPGDGDTYTRTGESTPWGFDRVLGETAGEWRLLFVRHRPKRYGPQQ